MIKNSSVFFYTYLFAGLLLIAIATPSLTLGVHFWDFLTWKSTALNSLLCSMFAFILASIVLHQFERFPQKNTLAFVLPISFSVFALLLTVLVLFRLSYSVKIITLSLLLTMALLGVQHLIMSRNRYIKLFVVPLGDVFSLESTESYVFNFLQHPVLPTDLVDGVVADMHSDVLTPEWERFLSNCALQSIPVYNAMQLRESITGKVNVKHLVANNFGDLSPSFFHQNLKRIIDIAVLIILLPIVLPIMAFVAIWIGLDSPGGVFFVQPRMGLGGKWFNVIKFRSMYFDHNGSLFTEEGEDHRITKVGKIIRMYRLDELPQFWNVLKGEMSLIGPRPESAELAKWYDNEVPFFAYRHVVRPGISGWAQVMHGYAAGVDDMKDKLAYDFYYIKHFSLWLDLLIWYKTIKTVITGFGSR